MTTSEFRLAIVLPVYNHGDAFERMFIRLQSTGLPMIAVDDGSDADTRRVLKNLARSHDQLAVVRLSDNQGKGAAVIRGLTTAMERGYSHALQIDADGQHDTQDIEKFLKAARQQPDSVVIGTPVFDGSMPRSRRIGRYFTHVWIWIETLSFDIRDSMCGFRVYPLRAVLPLLSTRGLGQRMDFDPEILVRLHWQGTPIQELRTNVIYPEGGRSNFRLLQDNVLITAMHTRLVFGMLWRLPRLIGRRLRGSNEKTQRHWAAIAERGSLLGLRFMLAIYRIFGRRFFQVIAALVAGYFTLTNRLARHASREYLDRVWSHSKQQCALPGKPGVWTTCRHFYCFAEAVLDKVAGWRGDITYDQIDHENLELFEARQREGLGGIWITSHLGNIEVCRAIGRRDLDFKLTVLMHTRHAENFNRLLSEVAPDNNIELLEVTEFNMATAFKLQDRISKGHFIIIVGDRTPVGDQGRVIACNFLGREANFPLGPFLLATLLDCPAGSLFCVREGDRFRIFIDDLPGLQGVKRKERAAAIESAARTFAGRLGSLCLRYPLQWFNFFPFWGEKDVRIR